MKLYQKILCAIGWHKWRIEIAGCSVQEKVYIEQKRCERCWVLKTRKV